MFSTFASTSPTSRFGALKVVGVAELDNTRKPKGIVTPLSESVVLGGNDSNTAGGTVNVPAETGAWQVNKPAK
jgi:hypothetical protein